MQVFFSTHKVDRGEDVCTCKFAVKWLHGPLSGEKTTLHIGNICLIPSLIVQDPVLDEFLDKVRKSVEVGRNIVDQTDGHLPSTPRQGIESITEKQDSSFSRFPDEIPGSVKGCTLKTPLDSLHNYEVRVYIFCSISIMQHSHHFVVFFINSKVNTPFYF